MRRFSLLMILALLSCQREERQFRVHPPSAGNAGTISQSDLQPGEKTKKISSFNPYEENAYAVSEGQRLYEWFNCVGCHGHGGGSIGPGLMDDKWIYGSEPANIFATIVEGRPNGMPSFRGRISDNQVWQLVAYVRSLSGLVRKDAVAARTDLMKPGPNPILQDPETPRTVNPTATQKPAGQ